MRTFDSKKSDFGQAGPISVARWEQYQLGGAMPFDAMWYTVAPGSSSLRDCHPELELSIVVAGTAAVEIAGEITVVPTGMSFLLDSEEAHIIHNRTVADPLMIFSAYWMPLPDKNSAGQEADQAGQEAGQASQEAEQAGQQQLVTESAGG